MSLSDTTKIQNIFVSTKLYIKKLGTFLYLTSLYICVNKCKQPETFTRLHALLAYCDIINII